MLQIQKVNPAINRIFNNKRPTHNIIPSDLQAISHQECLPAFKPLYKNTLSFLSNSATTKNINNKDLTKVIEQGEKLVDNIQNIKDVKEKSDVKTILIEIKDFVQNLLNNLNALNKELKSKITLDDIQEVVKTVAPSTVMVTGIGKVQSLGSGVIINGKNNKKYILTNAHVIDGIDKKQEREHIGLYRALLYNGNDYTKPVQLIASPVILDGKDIAYSPPEEHDLALLEIVSDTKLPDNLGVELRDLNKEPVMPGEPLIAVGSPFGLKDSITFGIASNVNRWMPFNKNTHIETDVPIGPGSSGGGLFDMKGRLVGINTWAIGNLGGSIRVDEIVKLLENWNITSRDIAKKNELKSYSLAA